VLVVSATSEDVRQAEIRAGDVHAVRGLQREGGPMTPGEREHLLLELDETRESLLSAVRGLSREQLEYHESPERWSVAENLEHIVIAEQGMLGWVVKTLQGAPGSAKSGDLGADDEALRNTLIASRKIGLQAPEFIRPTGRWPLAHLLPEFEAARKRTREFVLATDTDLRSRSRPHPQLGALDCYQWLVLIGSHCDRHRVQIGKVKASAGFPRQ
jgi:hypothetical protein